jgi:hypothetical protein
MTELGKSGVWKLPDREGTVTVSGKLLGSSSSRSMKHSAHRGESARSKQQCDCQMRSCPQCRCSACRWTEFRLFRTKDGYLLHRIGCSQVSGEKDRYGWDEIATAPEVIEVLTTRRRDRDPFLTVPAARLLAQASAFDMALRDAYENRAVV